MKTGGNEVCHYEVRDGLLNITWVVPGYADAVVDRMMERVRYFSRLEKLFPSTMEAIGRLARMSQQLINERKISMIDKVDIDLLESIPLGESTAWILWTISQSKHLVTVNVQTTISNADFAIKSMQLVQDS